MDTINRVDEAFVVALHGAVPCPKDGRSLVLLHCKKGFRMVKVYGNIAKFSNVDNGRENSEKEA